jgi:predicted cupin superfamily sugar epimerase
MLTSHDIISALNLKPLSMEGGFYRETYRSPEKISRDALPERYQSDKSFSTAIYYLLTPDTFSEIHRLATDEIFHFYLGDPVTMLLLYPDGRSSVVTIGQDIIAGEHVQYTIPAGTWFGLTLSPEGKFALMGTTVAPAFDFSDYESGSSTELLEKYPDQSDLIIKLTKTD